MVGLRGYAQRDPLNEYKTEAFSLFESLLSKLREKVNRQLLYVQIQVEAPPPLELKEPDNLIATHIDPQTGENDAGGSGAPQAGERPAPAGDTVTSRQAAAIDPNDPSTWGRVSRNALCPCGSGKKYKHCHGAV